MKVKLDSQKKNIAIDFDGVIHKYSRGWQDGLIYDKPIAGSKKAVIALARKYNIVIFSRRANEQGTRAIARWLVKNKIPYSEITGEKPRAKWYIDDQAVHFTNWREAIMEINRLDAEYAKRRLKEGFPLEKKSTKNTHNPQPLKK